MKFLELIGFWNKYVQKRRANMSGQCFTKFVLRVPQKNTFLDGKSINVGIY